MVNSRRKSMLSKFSSPLKDNPVYAGLLKIGVGPKPKKNANEHTDNA